MGNGGAPDFREHHYLYGQDQKGKFTDVTANQVTHICFHPHKRDESRMCAKPFNLPLSSAKSNASKTAQSFKASFQNSTVAAHNVEHGIVTEKRVKAHKAKIESVAGYQMPVSEAEKRPASQVAGNEVQPASKRTKGDNPLGLRGSGGKSTAEINAFTRQKVATMLWYVYEGIIC